MHCSFTACIAEITEKVFMGLAMSLTLENTELNSTISVLLFFITLLFVNKICCIILEIAKDKRSY